MRRVFCAWILFVGALWRVDAAQNPSPGTGLIIGQVVDGTSGSPLAGVIVTIGRTQSVTADQPPAPGPPESLATDRPRVVTGTDGRFVFRRIREGYVTFAAIKPGYIASRYGQRRPDGAGQWLLLARGQKLDGITVFLWKQASISGRVVDEAGEPLVSRQMLAFQWYVTAGRRTLGVAGGTTTDDRGMYRIAFLTPGEYTLALQSENTAVSLPIHTSFRSSPRRSGSSFLAPEPLGSAFSARLGDAIVDLRNAVTPPPSARDAPLAIYPTTYYPSARALAQAEIVTVGSGEERTGIDIQAVPAATLRVSGTVVGPGDAAAALLLMLYQDAGDATFFGPDSARTVTDAAGAFAFPLVPSGTYSVRAYRRPATLPGSNEVRFDFRFDPSDPGYWTQFPLAVGKTNMSGITIPLQRGLSVSGRVEFDGVAPRPPGNLFITIEPSDRRSVDSLPLPGGRVDENGRFTATGIPGGRYLVRPDRSLPGWDLRAVMFDGHDVSEAPLTLDGSDAASLVVTFTDRRTELSGNVVDDTGTGLETSAVLVFPPDPSAWASTAANALRFMSARTTAGGAYTLGRLRPGDYLVVAVRDEDAADWRQPKKLELLSRLATAIHLEEGDRKTLALRSRTIR